MPLIPECVRRLPWPWRTALVWFVLIYAVYLLAGNVFLNTPLFETVVNRKPEKFTLRTGPAVTLLPGHAIVWNIRIRGQANHTVYIFRAERASAWISLQADAHLQRMRDTLQSRLHFIDAQVPDLTAYNRYLGEGNVRLLGGTGLLSGDVELDTSGRVGRGRADLRGRGARLQVAGMQLAGDAQIKAQLKRADLEARQFDLGGSMVLLRNIRSSDGKGDAAWWGTLTLREGHIDAAAPFQVEARTDVHLRDAGPLLGVFAERNAYPRWVLGLLDSGEVQATGQLGWRRGVVAIDDLQAENERLSLRARLQMAKARKKGDLYLRWGALGAGIELDGDQRQWHLAGAREWYEGRPRMLPAPN